jgi:DNA-binding transcriptional MerR regulator
VLNIDKLTYSIGQVSELTGVAQSTLRYWETVILSLAPYKTEGGSRRYSKDDVEIVLQIKNLLYNRGFTIKGANQYLQNQENENQHPKENQTEFGQSNAQTENGKKKANQEYLKSILDELLKIKNILDH